MSFRTPRVITLALTLVAGLGLLVTCSEDNEPTKKTTTITEPPRAQVAPAPGSDIVEAYPVTVGRLADGKCDWNQLNERNQSSWPGYAALMKKYQGDGTVITHVVRLDRDSGGGCSGKIAVVKLEKAFNLRLVKTRTFRSGAKLTDDSIVADQKIKAAYDKAHGITNDPATNGTRLPEPQASVDTETVGPKGPNRRSARLTAP